MLKFSSAKTCFKKSHLILLPADLCRNWPARGLPSLLRLAGLPAQRGEEADQQCQQGARHRLLRLPSHLVRVRLPGGETIGTSDTFTFLIFLVTGCLHCSESAQYLACRAGDQGAGGGQQRHRLHRGLHRARPAKPAHHTGAVQGFTGDRRHPPRPSQCGRYLLSSSLMFQVLHSLSPAQLFVKLLKDFETIRHSASLPQVHQSRE